MNITILGASGFVGSALADYLQTEGINVFRLQRPSFDLTDTDSFTRIPPDTDILIHSAGYVGNAPNDDILWQTNIISNYYLTQHLNKHCPLRLVVFISSGAVYGMQNEPVSLNSPIRPEGLYAVSKTLGERIFETLLDSKLISLRIFFPFGPGQKPPRLIPQLIHRVDKDQPIEINSDCGLPIINPIYIDELINQIYRIIKKPKQPIYNLGGPESVSIRQIAETIGRLLGKTPTFEINNRPISNMQCRPDFVDVNALTFEDQLKRTIENADYL